MNLVAMIEEQAFRVQYIAEFMKKANVDGLSKENQESLYKGRIKAVEEIRLFTKLYSKIVGSEDTTKAQKLLEFCRANYNKKATSLEQKEFFKQMKIFENALLNWEENK